MNFFEGFLLVLHVGVALAICGFVLLQHGKGADMGAAFGSGASGSLFGASGSANFLSRTTAVLAVVFFASTLALAYFGNLRPASTGSVLENAAVVAPAAVASSAAPDAAAAAGASAAGAAQIPDK